MSLLARLALACYLAIAFVPQALARDLTPPPVQALVPFTSDEGLARFARAVGKIDFPALANQFEPQAAAAPRPAGCGSMRATIDPGPDPNRRPPSTSTVLIARQSVLPLISRTSAVRCKSTAMLASSG